MDFDAAWDRCLHLYYSMKKNCRDLAIFYSPTSKKHSVVLTDGSYIFCALTDDYDTVTEAVNSLLTDLELEAKAYKETLLSDAEKLISKANSL